LGKVGGGEKKTGRVGQKHFDGKFGAEPNYKKKQGYFGKARSDCVLEAEKGCYARRLHGGHNSKRRGGGRSYASKGSRGKGKAMMGGVPNEGA